MVGGPVEHRAAGGGVVDGAGLRLAAEAMALGIGTRLVRAVDGADRVEPASRAGNALWLVRHAGAGAGGRVRRKLSADAGAGIVQRMTVFHRYN